ncbi:MAG: hypothetical protein AAGA85_16235 [Bacteroidota bacterium]
MRKLFLKPLLPFAVLGSALMVSCSDDDDNGGTPTLDIPTSYVSPNFDSNVTAERTVIGELSDMTAAANAAESNAQTDMTIDPIEYPGTLSSVTLPSYRSLVTDWLAELVAAANSETGFINPGDGMPAEGEEGGLLGTRLLDENGLELEQNVQKGSFGAALYNHALTVINGSPTADDIDKLVEIHGTDVDFDPSNTTAAATYSRRRSNQTTETGFFYDIRTALITAKAAIEGGSAFDDIRDQALADYLLAWEKSNFATVIYYANATKVQLQAAGDDEAALGNALHAYAEGVAFAHGFKGVSNKMISDTEIDNVLTLLLAPEGEVPESYKFLNDATLLGNLDQVIDDLQAIYEFTDAEVTTFFVNDPT